MSKTAIALQILSLALCSSLPQIKSHILIQKRMTTRAGISDISPVLRGMKNNRKAFQTATTHSIEVAIPAILEGWSHPRNGHSTLKGIPAPQGNSAIVASPATLAIPATLPTASIWPPPGTSTPANLANPAKTVIAGILDMAGAAADPTAAVTSATPERSWKSFEWVLNTNASQQQPRITSTVATSGAINNTSSVTNMSHSPPRLPATSATNSTSARPLATPAAAVTSVKPATGNSNVSQPHPRIAIVSWLASDWSDDGYIAMLDNRRAYALKHGYEFLNFNETNLPTPELRQNWRSWKHFLKPRLLLALVLTKKYDWIVWTDADTLYTNATIPWTQFLQPQVDLVFAEAPDVISNNGVFAIRATPWCKSFLQDWIKECNASETPLAFDNGPFVHSILRAFAKTHNVSYNNECSALVRDPIDSFEWISFANCYRSHLRRISEVSGFNISHGPDGIEGSALVNDAHVRGAWGINSGLNYAFPCNWKPGDFLLHFSGEESELRREHALRYSNCIQSNTVACDYVGTDQLPFYYQDAYMQDDNISLEIPQ